ncbi:alpha/beta hydrolase [Trueperella pecoris]|uniref:Alpha/beta hydrolase n=1 Tax=Trueperella pecoris TaxID=2733571 RepID=A0A7M1R1H1_9ACTO|nr:alpha/beta hydrolase [Trueperella pecoris]QOR47385.1 alpha/beta hydrolase [Trueperella pecoris]
MWVILPGLALTPTDFAPLANLLPGRVKTLDAWALPLTSGARRLRAGLGADATEPLNLVGHSLGGLAALEWALVDDAVASLTLLDPTSPHEGGGPSAGGNPAGHGKTPRSTSRSSTTTLATATLAPLGPAGRYLTMRALAGADRLSRVERRQRFGTAPGLGAILDQLRALPALQRRVATLLAAPDSARRLPPTLHVIARPRVELLSSEFLREQHDLAAWIGRQPIELAGWNHLFPVAHPAEVAGLITTFRQA